MSLASRENDVIKQWAKMAAGSDKWHDIGPHLEGGIKRVSAGVFAIRRCV